MCNIITLYEIVPIGDGSHYLCQDSSGEYFTEHKAYTVKEQLAFYSEEMAQKYIDKYLDTSKYKPEIFGYNIDCMPFDIVDEVD